MKDKIIKLRNRLTYVFKKNKDHVNMKVDIKSNSKKISETYAELLRPLEKKEKIKHYILVAIFLIGILGGIKALFPPNVNTEALAVSETQTFVKTFAGNYFTYPSNDFLDKYFATYSLNSKWRIEYDSQKLVSATANNIEIYKVNSDSKNKNYADYYLYLTQNLTLKDDTKRSTVYNIKIRLYHDKDGYVVSEPVSMRTLDVPNIHEDDKQSIVSSQESGSEQLNEDDKKQLSNTISLFLTTYSTNFEQAKLLSDFTLDALDQNTIMEFESIISGTKSNSTYFVETSIIETLDETIKTKKNMHFEIDIENNKITEMEEY